MNIIKYQVCEDNASMWDLDDLDFLKNQKNLNRIRNAEYIKPIKLVLTDKWVRFLNPKEKHVDYSEQGYITFVCSNNISTKKIKLTPWIVAHRMHHSFSLSSMEFNDELRNILKPCHDVGMEIHQRLFDQSLHSLKDTHIESPIWDLTNCLNSNWNKYRSGSMPGILPCEVLTNFLYELSTFRSARTKRLVRNAEWWPETWAQFMVTGRVTFNDVCNQAKDWEHRMNEAYQELANFLVGKQVHF